MPRRDTNSPLLPLTPSILSGAAQFQSADPHALSLSLLQRMGYDEQTSASMLSEAHIVEEPRATAARLATAYMAEMDAMYAGLSAGASSALSIQGTGKLVEELVTGSSNTAAHTDDLNQSLGAAVFGHDGVPYTTDWADKSPHKPPTFEIGLNPFKM